MASFATEVSRVLRVHGIDETASTRIIAAYREDWRAYHNEHHIMGMLDLARRKVPDPHIRHLVELLIVYHDVWYAVGQVSGTSERRSLAWALSDFSTAVHHENHKSAYTRTLLVQGITATIKHTLDGVSDEFVPPVALLLDMDLWGIGQAPEVFAQDTEKIWREYERIVTREQFYRGRGAWARGMLERSRIYHTRVFAHLEEQARANLVALASHAS